MVDEVLVVVVLAGVVEVVAGVLEVVGLLEVVDLLGVVELGDDADFVAGVVVIPGNGDEPADVAPTEDLLADETLAGTIAVDECVPARRDEPLLGVDVVMGTPGFAAAACP